MRSRTLSGIALLVAVLAIPAMAALALDKAAASGKARIRFVDVASQTAEFIGYSRSIDLTPAQRAVRDRALAAIPAPCCAKFSMDTCCCPCNLAKSVWGLSNFLITRQHAGDSEVRRATLEWIRFVNPGGFTGDVCDTGGGCSRRFADDGCGGMDERDLRAAR